MKERWPMAMTLDEAKATAERLIRTYPEMMAELLDAGATPMEALLVVVRHEQVILKEVMAGVTPRAQQIRQKILDQTWERLRGEDR
jgi:hypothetical protein